LPDKSADIVIEIIGLTHRYEKGLPVLQGLNLTAHAGEIVGLIGLSGAGKSTLLRCVNGLITPTGGTLKVFGQDMPLLPERSRRLIRRKIGMIFQEFNLVDRLSVLKNVLVGRLGYTNTFASCLQIFTKSDVALARHAIEQVGLAEYEEVRVRNLSGGQKQRVAIARTIAQGAEIILGDEATANLDVRTTESVMDLLQELARKNNTCLLLSMHNLEVARRYCPRIVGLKNGVLTFDAASETLSDDVVREILE
jgi:phosphonate transport system ATP-binding protein